MSLSRTHLHKQPAKSNGVFAQYAVRLVGVPSAHVERGRSDRNCFQIYLSGLAQSQRALSSTLFMTLQQFGTRGRQLWPTKKTRTPCLPLTVVRLPSSTSIYPHYGRLGRGMSNPKQFRASPILTHRWHASPPLRATARRDWRQKTRKSPLYCSTTQPTYYGAEIHKASRAHSLQHRQNWQVSAARPCNCSDTRNSTRWPARRL